MRGMAPGENKFHREIAKTEFSQQGRKTTEIRQFETGGKEATEVENYGRPGFIRRNPPFALLPSC
jgi:hypothetical protein